MAILQLNSLIFQVINMSPDGALAKAKITEI